MAKCQSGTQKLTKLLNFRKNSILRPKNWALKIFRLSLISQPNQGVYFSLFISHLPAEAEDKSGSAFAMVNADIGNMNTFPY